MKECVLCKTRYEKGSGVTFHKFPTDNIRLELWLKNINKSSWCPKICDFICSKHFSDGCFIKHKSRTTLKKRSIPTIMCSSAENISSTHGSVVLPTPSISGKRIITPSRSVPETVTTRITITSIMDPNSTNLSGQKHRSTSCEVQQSIGLKKVRSLSEARDNIKHDHCYENTPMSGRKELQRIKKSLRISKAHAKVLSQHVKRLKTNVLSLQTKISELKKKD